MTEPVDRETLFREIGYVAIEMHAYCNRDCGFCPRFHDRSGVRKDANGDPVHTRMPTEKVFALIDELADSGFRGRVLFNHLSEPMLDKRYPDFVRHVAKRGLETWDNTNGDVLRQNERLCQELDGLVASLGVGLYDYTTYEEKLADIEFWQSRFKKTKLRFSTPWENTNARQNSDVYDKMWKDERVLDLPCEQVDRFALIISYDGEVHHCCQDDTGAFGIGNVFELGIEEVLRRKRELNQLLDQRGSRRQFELCSKCYYGTVPDSQKDPEELAKDRELAEEIKAIQERFETGMINVSEMWALKEEARFRYHATAA